MDLKKILGVLLLVVIFVAGAAMAVNVIFPNAVRVGIGVVEDSIFKGTGLSVDLDNDGTAGKSNSSNQYQGDKTVDGAQGTAGTGSGVEGVD